MILVFSNLFWSTGGSLGLMSYPTGLGPLASHKPHNPGECGFPFSKQRKLVVSFVLKAIRSEFSIV